MSNLKFSKKIILIMSSLVLFACGKTQFTEVATQSVMLKMEVPQDPVVPVEEPPKQTVNPVVPAPQSPYFKLSQGDCLADSSTQILSCQKCEIPKLAPIKPQLSAKAQSLVDIMYLACQIPNKSDRTSFHPTKEMIIQKLNRGSDLLYPDSKKTSMMALVVEGLSQVSDGTIRQKMFGGLWYTGQYSNAFETYFGLTVQEAKSTFCWDGNIQTPQITDVTGVYSKEWLACQYGDTPFSCQELPDYILAKQYREQLQNVLKLSITNPYSAPLNPNPKKCIWEKFDGNDVVSAKKYLDLWKSQGRNLTIELKNKSGASQCGLTSLNLNTDIQQISIGSYSCN